MEKERPLPSVKEVRRLLLWSTNKANPKNQSHALNQFNILCELCFRSCAGSCSRECVIYFEYPLLHFECRTDDPHHKPHNVGSTINDTASLSVAPSCGCTWAYPSIHPGVLSSLPPIYLSIISIIIALICRSIFVPNASRALIFIIFRNIHLLLSTATNLHWFHPHPFSTSSPSSSRQRGAFKADCGWTYCGVSYEFVAARLASIITSRPQ